ncbi:MAG TPA: DUF1631 family protein [Aquabacterium sp.]|nr:DUF1631 family protein [Aquabacterium sp.]HRH28508.1 DUF1631 family protein [Aquabacterium sp.]
MTDPRLDPILQSALSRLAGAVSVALDKAAVGLGNRVIGAKGVLERQALMDAQFDLQRRSTQIAQAFSKAIIAVVAKEVSQGQPDANELADTDWGSLRLVEDSEIEMTVAAARLAASVEAECGAELRSLQSLFATLRSVAADDRACPLRPGIIAEPLIKALLLPGDKPAVRDLMIEAVSANLGTALKDGYAQIVQACTAARVQAAPLVVRTSGTTTTGSPASTLAGGVDSTRHQTGQGALGSHNTDNDPSRGNTGFGPQGGSKNGSARGGSSPLSSLGRMFGMEWGDDDASGAGDAGDGGNGGGQDGGAPSSAPRMSDSGMLGLMRKLHSLSRMESPPIWSESSAGQLPASTGSGSGQGLNLGAFEGTAIGPVGQPPIAINVIRAHREALVEASGGAKLDQMVIDIVAALFDQVLADPKVPPQMARQISRLQLPVLRVALKDQSFFHSRRHPVRRLINRMASLSSSFDELDQGDGREFIEQVTRLVTEIVEGEFDQIQLYEEKLTELEHFAEQQTVKEIEENAAVATMLSGREADLRVQQRYMQKVQRELADLEIPEFVKTFLAQIWTQVQVMIVAQHGPESDQVVRMKQAAHTLVMSVQPKGHPSLRAAFLKQLPQLMKDLNEGLEMIQWAAQAKQDFFAQLLPLHAEALKTQPPHELTTRMLEQRLRKVEQIAVPSREEAANDPMPAMDSSSAPLAMAATLAPQEAQAAGWVSESLAVEDTSNLDIDLSAGDDADLSNVDFELPMDVPAAPAAGPNLVDFIQPGAAYRMLLKGQWKKVRLTWVSEARTFFMFNQGHHPAVQTISLTNRTLSQMCANGRFKAFEQAQLLERATLRARKQLAALNAQRKIAA